MSREAHVTQRRIHLLALLVAWVPLVSPSAERPLMELPRELVSVMRADERATRELHSLAETMYRMDQLTRAQHDCVLAANRTEFNEELASLVRSTLTMQEMQESLDYFRSEVGQKHLDAIDARENVSRAQWQQRRAFIDTRAGYLLITRALLTTSDEARRATQRISRRRLQDCERAIEASPKPPPDADADVRPSATGMRRSVTANS